MSPAERLLAALDARDCSPRRNGQGWTARCPHHDDRVASLTIGEGRDGRALVHCHTGCDAGDVLSALGLDWPDLFDGEAPKPWTMNGLRRTGAVVQRNGRVRLGGVAYEPGAPDDEKSLAVKGKPRDLWPEPATVPGDVVYVVEGEPDAQTGHELGLPVIGVPGAGVWKPDFAPRLAAGRTRVVILPDCDDTGRKAAAKWAADLVNHCPDVRILDLYPGRVDGADLSTYAADAHEARERDQAADVIRQAAELAPKFTPVGDAPEPATGSLAQRLADSRVDLLAHIAGGMPERAWLPNSARMLARGGRHHISAPLKSGKSLALETHAVDMTIAGATVAILDRENGADEYARRLRDVLADRPPEAVDAVRDRLAYYAWPALKLTDGDELARALAGVDLVIIDSTRTFLSCFALDENSSDDFAKFATALVEPLFRAGIATAQLDNSGHADKTRARGSSSKGDLADVLYTLKTTAAFDETRRGRLRLIRSHSRFGDVAPAFTMELGAGHFGAFEIEQPTEGAGEAFRPTELMRRVAAVLEEEPGLSKRAIRQAVKGTKNEAKDLALELLIAEGYVRVEHEGRADRHYADRAYDPNAEDRARPCPDRAQARGESTVPNVPLPIGGTKHGHGQQGTPRTEAAA